MLEGWVDGSTHHVHHPADRGGGDRWMIDEHDCTKSSASTRNGRKGSVDFQCVGFGAGYYRTWHRINSHWQPAYSAPICCMAASMLQARHVSAEAPAMAGGSGCSARAWPTSRTPACATLGPHVVRTTSALRFCASGLASSRRPPGRSRARSFSLLDSIEVLHVTAAAACMLH